ncbi:hypothetical protein ACT80S_14885 [Ramlibacter sp. MAHUQ-53]|uniref:hypothetical protein n=1 Tax=unclassified Ramlibacter TaxID=2617605 RepID=UPI00362E4869
MTWIRDTVADFGRHIGIDSLELGPEESVQLTFASGSILAVEPTHRLDEDEILVYMGRPVGHQLAPLLRIAMTKAHVDHGGSMPIQVASRGTGPDAMLIALVRLPHRTFTPQALVHATDHLGRWLDEVSAGGSR